MDAAAHPLTHYPMRPLPCSPEPARARWSRAIREGESRVYISWIGRYGNDNARKQLAVSNKSERKINLRIRQEITLNAAITNKSCCKSLRKILHLFKTFRIYRNITLSIFFRKLDSCRHSVAKQMQSMKSAGDNEKKDFFGERRGERVVPALGLIHGGLSSYCPNANLSIY